MRSKGQIQVEKFKYFGCILAEDWRCEAEVKIRISVVKQAFTRGIVKVSSKNLKTKKRLVNCSCEGIRTMYINTNYGKDS